MNIPMVRLELEGMKYAIISAFNVHQAEQDANVRAAVEAYCNSGNLQQVLNTAVRETLNRAIKDEVERFYTYGEGRALVKRLVQERLANGETELD
jgi:hypothetical protein